MGLLRVAVGIGLVVLLLPSDEAQQQRLYQNAAYAVERTTTFCDRNARSCETAANAWGTFVRKLEFGARMVYDIATRTTQDDGGRLEPVAVAPQPYAPAPVREGYATPSWRR